MHGTIENPSGKEKLHEKFHEILPEFTKDEFEKFILYLEKRHYAPGMVLWKQGDPAEFMGFLLEGRLVIKREGRFQGKNIILATLEKGSLFGEMASVISLRHTITLSVLEETEAYILTFVSAQRLFREEPVLSVKLLKKIVAVCGLRLQHTGARLAEIL